MIKYLTNNLRQPPGFFLSRFLQFNLDKLFAENCIMMHKSVRGCTPHRSTLPDSSDSSKFRESLCLRHRPRFRVSEPSQRARLLFLCVRRQIPRLQESPNRAVEEVTKDNQASQAPVASKAQGLARLAATSIVRLVFLGQQRRAPHLPHHVQKSVRLEVIRILNNESALLRLQDLLERALARGWAVTGKVRLTCSTTEATSCLCVVGKNRYETRNKKDPLCNLQLFCREKKLTTL